MVDELTSLDCPEGISLSYWGAIRSRVASGRSSLIAEVLCRVVLERKRGIHPDVVILRRRVLELELEVERLSAGIRGCRENFAKIKELCH